MKMGMASWYSNDGYMLTSSVKYSATMSYLTMLGADSNLVITDLVWAKILQPKYRFILWLLCIRRS